MHIHLHVRPHAGVEITVKEVMKKMFVPKNLRYVVKRVRADCTKCKRLLKKTVELEMSKLHPSRTMLAPIFFNCQMDVMYGPFKAQTFKRSRKVVTIYALVIVCLLSSATNILVLEGLETQDIVSAIERHSCRFVVPAEIFVDNGSQLCSLDSVSVALRDADTSLYDSCGLN